jgi:hypothetical protein
LQLTDAHRAWLNETLEATLKKVKKGSEALEEKIRSRKYLNRTKELLLAPKTRV